MIRCVVVDDEPLARDVLQMYIAEDADLKLIASCKNAREAMQVITNEHVDVVFLDIQMPDISGMTLAKTMKDMPYIIFTTAYSEYAVEGFEVSAVDYLMKPISPERFKKAIDKLRFVLRSTKTEKQKEDFIFIRADYQDFKVRFEDILYIEGLKDYVKIVTTQRRYITLTNIKGILEKLPDDLFVRVHKSYVVALDKVESVKGSFLTIGEKEIPIGLTFKDNFKKMLNLRD